MLSVNEQIDFPYENSFETHEEVAEKSRLERSESIIIEQKKGSEKKKTPLF